MAGDQPLSYKAQDSWEFNKFSKHIFKCIQLYTYQLHSFEWKYRIKETDAILFKNKIYTMAALFNCQM